MPANKTRKSVNIRAMRLLNRTEPLPATREHWRPRRRADCSLITRPCPYFGCVHHLRHDVSPFGTLYEYESTRSCALDVAEEGEHTLQEVAEIMGISTSLAAYLEHRALKKAYDSMSFYSLDDFILD